MASGAFEKVVEQRLGEHAATVVGQDQPMFDSQKQLPKNRTLDRATAAVQLAGPQPVPSLARGDWSGRR